MTDEEALAELHRAWAEATPEQREMARQEIDRFHQAWQKLVPKEDNHGAT
jgi:hypothetical protein